MTPVVIQDEISIAANTTVENVIASNTGTQRYIRAPFNAIGQLLAGQSAAGLRFELVVDGETVLDSSDVGVLATSVTVPDNIMVEQFRVRQGGQLVLRVVNTTAGTLTAKYRISMAEAQEWPPVQRITARGPISIAANTTVQLLTGMRFERPLVDSIMKVFALASATGINLELFVDGTSVAPASPVRAGNKIPTNPYDQVLDGIEVPQDKLIELRATNTTAGALSFFFMTMLQELVEKA